MNVVFRVDATSQIGSGHFMRCMSLADELQRHGVNITVISRNLPQYLQNVLEIKGIDFFSLESSIDSYKDGTLQHSHWLSVSQLQDAKDSIQALSALKCDWLIVDHYALDEIWEKAMRPFVARIMVIDDIADRCHDCDLLLDQNLYADMQQRYADKVPTYCRQLLGPRFALLRDEFRKLRKQVMQRFGPVKKILVFFGGVDPENYTGRTITALAQVGGDALQVDVVIGIMHPCREEIEELCKLYGYDCHVQTNYMADLMAGADLAIGAGGSAMWERCSLGLPSLSVCVADNQYNQINHAAEYGLVLSLPNGDDLTYTLQRQIDFVLKNEPLRKLISKAAMQEVDGFGVSRVVTALGISKIKIRAVKASDSLYLFEWRNHHTIMEASKNSTPISFDEHQSWFSKVLIDENKDLLIGEIEGEPIGVVRFDKKDESALVSIYLVPKSGLVGLGHDLLLRAEAWLKARDMNIKNVKAEVLGANTASQRLFIGANYRIETIHYVKGL